VADGLIRILRREILLGLSASPEKNNVSSCKLWGKGTFFLGPKKAVWLSLVTGPKLVLLG